MNHDEAEKLLGPYRDGELDLNTCLKLEEHLAACPSCQQKLTAEEELVTAIQSDLPRYKASPYLKTRILANLRAEASPSLRRSPLSLRWIYSLVTGAAVACFLLTFTFFQAQQIPDLAREGVANHVRSLQANHLMDVVSTDQHTVKPWFAGKLDYSPQVVDLGPSGYPLVGGRLDVLDHRDVAAVIYQRRKHYINLFIWPATADTLPGKLYNQDGYHVLGWTRSGMNYLAVSELGEKEFREFVQMIQDQTVDSRPGE